MNTGRDVEGSEDVRIQRSFDAPAQDLFAAWTDAGKLQRWAWGQLGSDTHATVDCRVGGEYRVTTARPDGTTWSFWGKYIRIVPNQLLAYTVNWDAPMGYESPGETVEVTFRPSGQSTEVEFTHKGVPTDVARREHRKGWNDTLDTLSTLLQGDP